MRVLQLLPSMIVGGVERGVLDLARALKRRSIEIAVASQGGPLVDELSRIDVPHHRIIIGPSENAGTVVRQIRSILESEQIEILHARGVAPVALGWLAARATGTTFLSTCHCLYPPSALTRFFGRGKRVIAVSEAVRAHLISMFAVSEDRIRVIPRGVDVEEFRPRTAARALPSHRRRIVNIGRLAGAKGQLELVRAVWLLRQRLPNLEVWLIGEAAENEASYGAALHEAVRELGLTETVRFLGIRRDIAQLLAGADLLVHSPIAPESFGRVLIEAGAVGVPVVSCGTGGVSEILEHRVDGLLVPPQDAEAMANAMFELLTNDSLASTLSRSFQRKVIRDFSLDQMVEKTAGIYRELASERHES